MTITTNGTPTQPEGYNPETEYMALDNPVTERVLSCQNITPSYYPNMMQPMIGKRPVYTSRNFEGHIPEMLVKNKDNLSQHEFNCYQPTWTWTCM
jgi:predicted RNA methylase